MRVAMVSEHASPLATLGGVDAGGQNVHVAALAQALGSTGTEVVVHTRRDRRDLAASVPFAPGVTVEHLDAGPPRVLPKDALRPFVDAMAQGLRTAWTARRPDVVHAHFWMSGLAALEAARPLGIPVVVTFHALGTTKHRHQGGADTSPAGRAEDEARVAQAADRIIATSSDEVFELARMGVETTQISVVPCGVDVGLFCPSGPVEDRPSRRHRLVAVSRLVPRKGLADVIEALSRLPDAELIIAGGGATPDADRDPEAQRLGALARQLGVADRVEFRGSVAHEALPALLRSADLVVCSPWYEPFGLVPLEAMACGVPVVASAVGGIIDTVRDGVTGQLVQPRDAVALAHAIGQLLADPVRRREYSRASVSRVRQRYQWSRIAASTLGVYDEVVDSAAALDRMVSP